VTDFHGTRYKGHATLVIVLIHCNSIIINITNRTACKQYQRQTTNNLSTLYSDSPLALKLSLGLTKYHAMKYPVLHAFLTSTLDAGEWSTSRPGRFTAGERAPVTH
jgi:hypothetical protein